MTLTEKIDENYICVKLHVHIVVIENLYHLEVLLFLIRIKIKAHNIFYTQGE